jgi:hypothetical protein
MRSLTVLASFVVLAAAQSQNIPLELAAVKAHFQQSLLVPELLKDFDPTVLINVNYAGAGDIATGQLLTKDQVGSAPTITVIAPAGVKLDGNYTLAMVDPGAVGEDQSSGVTRHWLVNSLTIDGGALKNASALSVTEYAGPAPPLGSGPHRYTFLLYSQPAEFNPPNEFSGANIGVSKFDVTAYATASKLGPIIGGSYIRVQDGEPTVSLAPTSAVVTSALSAPATTGSRTGTSTGTGAGAATGTPKSNDASNTVISPLLALAGLALMVMV